MPSIDRRRFLKGAAGAATAAAIGGPFQGFTAMSANANGRDRQNTLRAVPDLRDGKVRLWLPEGSSTARSTTPRSRVVPSTTAPRLPGRHDGMGAFPGARTATSGWSATTRSTDPVTARSATRRALRPDGPGRHDHRSRSPATARSSAPFTSLNGTQMNCSGGRMPWGSWITCEETVNGPDVGPDFTGASNITLTQPHGFIFEVPAGGQSNRQPITAAGRFAHEAVAFDPRDGVLYLTEDNFGFPSGFYRYARRRNPMDDRAAGQRRPAADARGRGPAQRRPGGRAARRRDATTSTGSTSTTRTRRSPTRPGRPAPTTNNDGHHLRRQPGAGAGRRVLLAPRGRRVRRRRRSTSPRPRAAAPAETGHRPIADGYGNGTRPGVGVRTRRQTAAPVVYQSPGADALDFPDNITTSPRGTLVLCEDNVNDNYIRGLTPRGRLFDIALNRLVSSTGDRPRPTTSSPGRRSAPTARRCSSTSRPRAG